MKKFELLIMLFSTLCFVSEKVICEKPSAVDSCNEGSTWIDGCNNCTCINNQTSCTPTHACDIDKNNTSKGVSEITCNFTSERARWRFSCNWCRCHPNGYQMCIKKACPPLLEMQIKKKKKQCELNAIWKKDSCNWCECVNDTAKCSNKTCGAIFTLAGTDVPNTSKTECKYTGEVSTWSDSCNTCNCSENSRKLCSDKICPKDFVLPPFDNCVGNAEWRIDNGDWCRCENGNTKCITSSRGKSRSKNSRLDCEKTGRWKKHCNWCSCTLTGRARCTLRGCLSPYDPNKVPICRGSVRWKRDGNWYDCVNGRGVCTEIHCSDVDDPNKVPICRDSGSWKRDCNWCDCVNGREVCTEIHCSDVDDPNKVPICRGSVRWKRDCNWCDCVNGKGVCTEIHCSDVDTRRGKQLYIANKEKCLKGKSWVDNCNTCFCIDQLIYCTTDVCKSASDTEFIAHSKVINDLQSLVEESLNSKMKSCKSGSSWLLDFCGPNWCSCHGDSTSCTLMGCMETGINNYNDKQCTKGSIWKDNCNKCFCLQEKIVCTTDDCSAKDVIAKESSVAQKARKSNLPEKIICTEGSQWTQDCNWCSCFGGQSICTLISCANETIKEKCIGDSKWKKKCNWCHCVNGNAVCTTKICETGKTEIPSQSPPASHPILKEECVNGNTWKDECNTCVCVNKIQICTKKACDGDFPIQSCAGRQTWKKDCNSCHCLNGNIACTRRLCPSIWNIPDSCNKPAIEFEQIVCGNFLLRKWTYYSNEGRCRELLYENCGRNANVFNTEEECMNACSSQRRMESGKFQQ